MKNKKQIKSKEQRFKPDKKKLKILILRIIEQYGNIHGKISDLNMLANLCWFCDMNSYLEHGKLITGYTYIKTKHGFKPDGFNKVIKEIQNQLKFI